MTIKSRFDAGRDLRDAVTDDFIRTATDAEAAESDAEVDAGRFEGEIEVDGRLCYVTP
jgi:hypothetical protein